MAGLAALADARPMIGEVAVVLFVVSVLVILWGMANATIVEEGKE